jgi:hypothetical protein
MTQTLTTTTITLANRWELDTVDYQALEDFLFPKQEEAE